MLKSEAMILRRIGRRFGKIPPTILVLTVFSVFLCVAAISLLTEDVRRQVDRLSVSNNDSMQWSLVQTEVDILMLQAELRKAIADGSEQLSDVRTRFDVLYSRIDLLDDSRQFADLRALPSAQSNLATLNAFLAKNAPIVDGPKELLVANLDALLRDTEDIGAAGRDIALLGLRLAGADADTLRASLVNTLSRIGYVTALLILTLLSGIAILYAMFRRLLRSEAVADDARSWLRRIIAASLDGIIAADTNGRIIEYNGAAERLFGHSKSEAMGRDLAELIVPAHLREAHRAGWERYRKTGKAHVLGAGLVRLEALRKNGEVFPAEVSLSSSTFDGREVLLAFLRDITDQLASEREIIEARDMALAGERAKADLLAVMSHEMRTPLNGILGAIQLMQGTSLTEKQRGLIAAQKTSAELLLQHVNSVLGLSRAEAKCQESDIVEINPIDLMKELIESQRPAIEANGNRIRFNYENAPTKIWVDPTRLRQVSLNLIANASKFTRSGEITVECDTIEGGVQVEFRVIDTGIGIAEEDLELIFEEFKILDTRYSRGTQGTGLGLSISRKLVHGMGGEIGVESELGEGSMFWFRLPIGSLAQKRRRKPTRKHAGSGGLLEERAQQLKLLLVEDNYINRLVAREMLQKAGHSVVEAHNGHEAVDIASRMPFDLILMDISMPEVDGVAATLMIREEAGPNRAVPIFALTAFALPNDAERFKAAGISKTLIKPLVEGELLDALASVAKRPQKSSVVEEPLEMPVVFRDLCERLGPSKAALLYRRFRDEGNNLLSHALSKKWNDEPAASRADAVHKVAGSAALLGANSFRELLLLLEATYRSGESGTAELNIDRLKAIWDHTLDEIARMLHP